MIRLTWLLLSLASICGTLPACAQGNRDAAPVGSTTSPARFPEILRDGVLGLEASMLVPRGDFAPGNTLSIGYGIRAAFGVGWRKVLDVGAAFRSIAHDSRKYNDTTEVKNMMRTLTMSARLVAPLRYARPYVGASAGAAYFGTERMIERCCDDEGDEVWELDGIRLARFTPTGSARAGLLVDVWKFSSPGDPVLSLDVAIEDHRGGMSSYQIDGYGPVRESGTNYRVYSLGLSVRTR